MSKMSLRYLASIKKKAKYPSLQAIDRICEVPGVSRKKVSHGDGVLGVLAALTKECDLRDLLSDKDTRQSKVKRKNRQKAEPQPVSSE